LGWPNLLGRHRVDRSRRWPTVDFDLRLTQRELCLQPQLEPPSLPICGPKRGTEQPANSDEARPEIAGEGLDQHARESPIMPNPTP
jgi:hypothetical protein